MIEWPDLSSDVLSELSAYSEGEGFGGYTVVRASELCDRSRWHITYEWIIKRESDGTCWAVRKRCGATEYQDSDDAEIVAQVRPVERTAVHYERV